MWKGIRKIGRDQNSETADEGPHTCIKDVRVHLISSECKTNFRLDPY